MFTPVKQIVALLLVNIVIITTSLIFIILKIKGLKDNVPLITLEVTLQMIIAGIVQFVSNNLMWKYVITGAGEGNKWGASFVLVIIGACITILLTGGYIALFGY